MSGERCAVCGGSKSGHGIGGCACEIPQNLCSTQHEHEPEIPPAYDHEGRCLICVMLVEARNLKTIAFHLGEDKKELQTRLAKALSAEKDGWNRFYALRKLVAEQKYPNMTNEVKANELPSLGGHGGGGPTVGKDGNSPTPETDAAVVDVVELRHDGDRHFKAVPVKVSRKLEREAYENAAMLVKIKRASCVTKGQTDELDALLAAIGALAEGEK